MPPVLGHKQSATSCNLTGDHIIRSAPLCAQRRGNAGRRNYKFLDEDDEKIIQLREKGLTWDEIALHFPNSTKGSVQVRYSKRLKDRPETPKLKKRRRAG